MGADHEVDATAGETFENLLRFGIGLEPAQLRHVDGETRESGGEGLVVLADEQGGGHQHSYLFAVLDGLECGPDRDLGLAEPDVTADQAVHGDHLLHVGLDLLNRRELVGGLDETEGVLQFPLPGCVGAESVTLGGLSGGIELDELGGDFLDGLARPGFAFRPVGAAHLIQGGGLRADVAGQLIELIHRHEQPVAGLAAFAGGVLDDEVVADRTLNGALYQLHEPPDPVDLVDDRVTCLELEGLNGVATATRQFPLAAFRALLARQFGGGQQLEFHGSCSPAAPEGPNDHMCGPGLGFGVEFGNPRCDVVFGQQLGHAIGQAFALDTD